MTSGARADKGDFGSFANFGEIRVLGEKSVARMDRIDVGDFGGADHLRDVEIAFGAARRADANGFVGETHVQRVAIGFGIHGDRGDSEFLAGADDSQRDFAAVGN